MAIKWRNIQGRLRLFGKAVQGPDAYRIEFADEPGLTGLMDFEQRLVRVNPEIVPAAPAFVVVPGAVPRPSRSFVSQDDRVGRRMTGAAAGGSPP